MDERKRIFRLTRWILILTGIAGLTFASYAAYIYVSLKQISDPKKCFTTSMYKVYLCPSSQSYIRFQQVPQHFIRALILSEDTSFYSHKGLDWFEIKESFRRNFQEWKFARGGSTITQQLAKNLYLSSEKSIDRKIKEFFLAQQIEKYLNKNQILEKYVNVVEFGPNIFGIDKASRHYFGKAVESLNVLESVYLVSLLPSPKRYSKSFKTQKLSRINISRMKIILGRMYRTHRITDEVYVFSETLIDTYDWPFPHYSNPFQEAEDTIQNELMEEFNEMEDNQEEPEFEDEVKQAVQEAENETEENFEPIPEASE
ncbi:MAG: transglycosylase domain-containing protein, partial [Bdellovibrionales bacterium]|nr:transglycosylase domain-containing protein [Bdellovibrionales bacterium]